MTSRRHIAVAIALAGVLGLFGPVVFANPQTPDQLADRARIARAAADEAKQAQAREMQQWTSQTEDQIPRAGWQSDLMAAEAVSRATERVETLEQRARAAQQAADEARAGLPRASDPVTPR